MIKNITAKTLIFDFDHTLFNTTAFSSSMNQFFTGYFPLLAVYGNDAFKKIYGDYLEMKKVRKS